jgi:hypothetical protein
MRTFTIVAMVFLFLFVGVQRFAQADEKAQMVETKGEANAKAETDKEIGQLKALAEGAKENQAKGTMERAKGTTKVGGERVKAPVEQPKTKPE